MMRKPTKALIVVLLSVAVSVNADVVRTRGGGGSFAGGAISANSTWTGQNEFSGQTNISGPDSTTNVEIGSTANDANAGTGGTSVVIGNAATNASNGSNSVLVGASATATGGGVPVSVVGIGSGTNVQATGGVAVGAGTLIDAGGRIALGQSAAARSSGAIVLAGTAGITSLGAPTNAFIAAQVDQVFFGKGFTSTTATAYAINGTGGSGANNAGAALQLAGGISTGNAAAGTVVIRTSTPAASSSTPQSLADRLTITDARATATVPWVSATATPAVSNTSANSCGTTAATIAGTNETGIVTVGATGGTSCTVTFTVAAPTRRQCVVTNETTANLARSTTSSTTVSLFAGTFVGGDVLGYICMVY